MTRASSGVLRHLGQAGGLSPGNWAAEMQAADGGGGEVFGAMAGPSWPVATAPRSSAGPQIIANPADYVDAPVVFRQYCCPSCWTALYSAVVPAGHPDTVTTLGLMDRSSQPG
jgi:N-methylhydantoinase B